MKKLLVFISFTILLISACSETDNSVEPVNPSVSNGRLKLYLSDSPASFDSVIICISRVEIHRSGTDTNSTNGWFIINDSLRYFDLLQLQNGAMAVLGDTSLEEGKYTQIRLILEDNNYLIKNGMRHKLTVPGGTQTGLKLIHNFTIESNTLYELLLDFNIDKSILITGNGKYKLKPTVRVIPVVLSGSISGQVLPLEAQPTIWTTFGDDTITTYTNSEGFFKLMGLLEGIYDVNITPSDTNYNDTTITGVQVLKSQNTNLGTVTLSSN